MSPTNEDIDRAVLHRLNFERSKGCTFAHLMEAAGLLGDAQERQLNRALKRLKTNGTIRFSKTINEWVIA